MGIVQIPQQLTGVFTGALRGAGDTKFPMVIAAIGLWGIRLPFAYLFSLYFDWGILGVWVAMTLDLFVRFGLSAFRYLGGRWRVQLERMARIEA
jgi:Na+-driven multidrug efflux pump